MCGPSNAACSFKVAQKVQCFLAGERVREVPHVGGVDEFFRGHVGKQLPQRLAGPARGHVPHGVHHGGEGEVDDAFLRAEPA